MSEIMQENTPPPKEMKEFSEYSQGFVEGTLMHQREAKYTFLYQRKLTLMVLFF